MLLSPDQVLARLEAPAATAILQQGRELERRHRLHIEGDKGLLWRFLLECRPDSLVSETEYNELQKIIKSGTKDIYSGLINMLSKAITAQGTTRYFDFAQPRLLEDWQDYIKGYAQQGAFKAFEQKWFAASLTGFQGLFLVDTPREPEQGLPKPYFKYIPSAEVFDVLVEDDKVEYVALTTATVEGVTDYYCWDDQFCYRFRHEKGKFTYLETESTQHGLGYVPACMVTSKKPELKKPALRTSYVDESLERADVYLVDFNNLQWSKRFHSFQKFWSYGVRCEHVQPATLECAPTACNAGYLHYETGKVTCPRCQGKGRYIPVGADKTYIVEVPQQGDPSIVPPAGYIRPELDSPQFIAEELKTNASLIEKSVLGKEGILEMQTKQDTLGGKELDLGPFHDRLTTITDDEERAESFVFNTMARLRYLEGYRQGQINKGRRYQTKSVAQAEADYAAAKKAGLDETALYPYLEEIIYARWVNDPMELERNLLKLQLTPFPTCTVAEARADGVATPNDLALKRYLNDFVVRFEEENGSILEFGSVLAPAEKLRRIREIFSTYLTEKSNGNSSETAFTFLAPVAASADPGNLVNA